MRTHAEILVDLIALVPHRGDDTAYMAAAARSLGASGRAVQDLVEEARRRAAVPVAAAA